MMPAEPVIAAKGLAVRYGKVQAVYGVDLAVGAARSSA